jgi:UDP-GlcNAc:undecaprenyl-phosphate GlcNAc-1-phosphate transferase
LTTTTLSVLSVTMQQPWLAGIGVLVVLALLILTRSFGHAEVGLLMGRAAHFAQSLATKPEERHHRRFPLQGVGRWERIWEPLVEFAKTHELAKLKIDLNLSWLHEGYHATWQNTRLPEKSMQMSLCVPLYASRGVRGQVAIGRLEVIAAAGDSRIYERISDLGDRLVDLAPQIDRIIEDLERRKAVSGRTTRPRRSPAARVSVPERADSADKPVPLTGR